MEIATLAPPARGIGWVRRGRCTAARSARLALACLVPLLGWRTADAAVRLGTDLARPDVEELSKALSYTLAQRIEWALADHELEIAAALERLTSERAIVHVLATRPDSPTHRTWLRLSALLHPRVVAPVLDAWSFEAEPGGFVLRLGPPARLPALAGAAPLASGELWALHRIPGAP